MGLEEQVVIVAFDRMAAKGYFSVCDFKKCQEILSVHTSTKRMVKLEALHCVHFSDMPPDVVKFVKTCCMDLFHLAKIDFVPQTKLMLVTNE